MHFDVVTIFPEMFEALAGHGITRRALEEGLFELKTWDPRDFTTDNYRRVDDRTYEIVVKVDSAVVATSRVVVSPDGKTLRVSTQERNPNGQITHTTAVYEKF